MTGPRSATQRARLQARLARRGPAPWETDDELDPPPITGAGSVAYGQAVDADTASAVDPRTGAVWDSIESEARDIRQMLKAYYKARQLAAVLSYPIKGASWQLVPGKGDTGEAAATEEQLRRGANAGGMTTPMQQVIGQMCTAIWYRKAYFAKALKLDPVARDGTVMYKTLAMRPATTCRLRIDTTDGSFRGFEQDVQMYALGQKLAPGQKALGAPIQFEPRQALVYVHGADEDPINGVSALEVALWCWRTQQKILFLLYQFLEGAALPRTVVKHTGDEQKARAAATQIAKVGSSGVIYFDGANLALDVLNTAGSGAAPFVEAIKYLDGCVSGAALAGFTDLSSMASSGRGSLALSKDQSDFFLQSRLADAREIESTLTEYAIADLIRYNYGPEGVTPRFTFDPLAGVDDQPTLQLLQALATAAQTALPREFVNELAVNAARVLHLDVDKITTALEKAAAEAAANPPLPAAAGAVAPIAAAVRRVGQIAGEVAAR